MKILNKWAERFQRYMAFQSNKMYGSPSPWDDPWTLILSKTMILFLGLTIFLGFYVAMFTPKQPSEYRNLQSLPFGGQSYFLYTDDTCGGFGDTSWIVVETDNAVKPIIPCDIDETQIGNKGGGINIILTNYTEDGSDINKPNITVLKNQYLVFSRGGHYYGLYDTKTKTTLFNVYSPWGEYQYQTNGKGSYAEWAKTNIEEKIKKLIE